MNRLEELAERMRQHATEEYKNRHTETLNNINDLDVILRELDNVHDRELFSE